MSADRLTDIDIERILLELEVLPEYEDQISLQGVEGQKDHLYGTGFLHLIEHTEQDFTVPLFDMPYTNSIMEQLGMTRTRVMRMPEKSCYSYHKDQTKRIHIPLVTNDKCLFIIDDIVYRYPADGNYYVADTTKLHTFVNGSWEDRIHIVGCIKE